MAVDIIVTGALGRMGREIVRCILSDSETRLAGCTETAVHPNIGDDIGMHVGMGKTGVTVRSAITDLTLDGAVIIDFTTPSATEALLDSLAPSNAAVVIGTTGLAEENMAKIRAAARQRAVLQSPNMSVGVNLLFYLTEIAAAKLHETFDIEIIEAHHRFKKDAPSGTARALGAIASVALGRGYNDAVVNGREGMVGERTRQEIGMHAVRGGDIVGDHTVLFAGQGERIELRHMAHSRATFARGAVAAAKWLHAAKPGLYSMRDVLEL
jgi:4-hydroxy-tetrahydrodipicolinate reductase